MLKFQKFLSAIGVLAVVAVSGYVSYGHQVHVATMWGQGAGPAKVYPFLIDGMLAVCGGKMAVDRKDGWRPRAWAVAGFWLGFALSFLANWFSVTGGLGPHFGSAVAAVCFLISVEAMTTRPTKRLAVIAQVDDPQETVAVSDLTVPVEPVAASAAKPVKSKPAASVESVGRAEQSVTAIAAALEKLPKGTATELAKLSGKSTRTVRRYKALAASTLANTASVPD